MTVRYELLQAAEENPMRGMAAAVGACWSSGGRPKARLAGCRHNVMVYGGQVLDELLARGVDLPSFADAGRQALILLAGSLPVAADVDAAEGFSEAGAAT